MQFIHTFFYFFIALPGTFLVPYIVAFLLVALPMVLLEEGAGQFVGMGAVKIYRAVCPALKGVGITSMLISWSCSVYFAMIMGWILVYCYYASFSTIPWSTCKNEWNTPGNQIVKSI
jgi:SNF family Na+-dependent transporter